MAVDRTLDAILARHGRDIALLKRRVAKRPHIPDEFDGDLGAYGALKTGILAPSYRGPGPASVLIDGEGAFSGPYEWLSPYVPNGSREVSLLRFNGTWVILQQDDMGKRTLTLASNWLSYNQSAIAYEWPDVAVAARLPSGIVVLSGLIRATGTPANGTNITTLPVGMRPDTDLLVGVNNSDTAKYIRIYADGRINAGESFVANGYISLDGIAFPAAGVATWTEVGSAGSGSAFTNGWVDYGDAAYGKAAFWKDPYDFVWFRGMVKNGTTTDNTQMFTLPATHRVYKNMHIATASFGALGIVGADTVSTGLTIKAGNTGNGWVSLANVVTTPQAAFLNNPWRTWPAKGNGWTDLASPGTYYALSELRRGDGLVILQGMLTGGTAGSRVGFLSPECTPNKDILMQNPSNAGRGRIDIGGMENSVKLQSSLFPQQGTSWFSFDSIHYIP